MQTKQLQDILTYLSDELGGDWLLTGGALVRLRFDAERGTEDIDLARIGHASLSGDAVLSQFYRWLIDRGLGPEWVNTAVEPFLYSVENWRGETVLIHKGPKGRIFRPNLTLFVYLKLGRATEIDLEDIRKAVPHCSEGFDAEKFERWADPARRSRLRQFRDQLGL